MLDGIGYESADLRVEQALAAGEEPAMEDIMCYVVESALLHSKLEVPSVRSGVLYNEEDDSRIRPSPEVLFVRELISYIADNMKDPELSDAILKAYKLDKSGSAIIEEYVQKLLAIKIETAK